MLAMVVNDDAVFLRQRSVFGLIASKLRSYKFVSPMKIRTPGPLSGPLHLAPAGFCSRCRRLR
ncbi:hypothetical protein FD951_20535 [Pseudomonas chlororaphis subsp. aurantiaca]|nr:hypothetical protein FD951_20535 [Pseudomonas chlororaphis subsp. aurantiaca]